MLGKGLSIGGTGRDGGRRFVSGGCVACVCVQKARQVRVVCRMGKANALLLPPIPGIMSECH